MAMQDSHFQTLSAHLLLPVSVILSVMSESQSRRHHGLSEIVHSIRDQVCLPAASTQTVQARRHQDTPPNRQDRTRGSTLHLSDTCVCPSPCHRVTEVVQSEGLDLQLHLSSFIQEGIPHSQEDVADQAVHKGHQKPVEGDE